MSISNYYGVTRDDQGIPFSDDDSTPISHPDRIGRYVIQDVLGKGGFGIVFLAFDEQLDRQVAIKVPHAKLIKRPQDAEAYLAEARTVANLDHPNIVPVHDVGNTLEFPCFIVSKYIEGIDLQTKVKLDPPNYAEAVELLATIADALHYAHTQGLVHRDVKPGNILVDQSGKPFVVDFGLALREENIGLGPRYAGTPGYMSPEQAGGEGHRVDGRSDIFSLGVMLYRLLTGRLPFRGKSADELLYQVKTFEPKPIRQYDARIPKELERICYKAMAKKASERYSSSFDMAEDLRHLLSSQALDHDSSTRTLTSGQPNTPQLHNGTTDFGSSELTESIGAPVKIVPKGLRAFAAQDADFILELIPGAKDRDGLPEGIRFWKTQIEETDPDNTFPVGLIYGPSGCGKTSLVKAGLLPRLSENIIPVYIEATQDDTESRLLNQLRKRCPNLSNSLDLKQSIAALRLGTIPHGKKVLIVLDQFEQWLHAKKEESHTELVQALRHCDGGRVQAIIMVRDDFWMAVTRFLGNLEVKLVQGHNFAPVDLFPARHAKKVLAAFGRAFSVLPSDSNKTSKKEKEFLDLAVEGLTQNGKVICVQLALFAEMMKGKPWTPTTLREVGGTKGIGVNFLEETFSVHNNPAHRLHHLAARRVLKALLPESGTNIKGQMKSHDELLKISGYTNRRKDFDELVRILDSEMRLLTPTDPQGIDEDELEAANRDGLRYFQLTHDYLVPSLRQWLTRKQKETRQGRAEIRLAERAKLWSIRKENQQLPSLFEFLNIRILTDRKSWSRSQSRMMQQARSYHWLRTICALIVVAALGWIGNESFGRTRAHSLVAEFSASEISEVPERLESLSEYWRWAEPLLKKNAESVGNSPEEDKQRLRARIALVESHPEYANQLFETMLNSSLPTLEVIRDQLAPYRESLATSGWEAIRDRDNRQQLNAACALARLAPDDVENWSKHKKLVAKLMVEELSRNAGNFELLARLLSPVKSQLIHELSALSHDFELTELKNETAFNVSLNFGSNNLSVLCDLLLNSTPEQFERVFRLVQAQPDELQTIFHAELNKSLAVIDSENQTAKVLLGQRQANAAIGLARLGLLEKANCLFEKSDDPRGRSWFIRRVPDYSVKPEILLRMLDANPDSKNKVHQQITLLHAIGGYATDSISTKDRARLAPLLLQQYRDHPDPGIHSSVAWLLRKWEFGDQLSEIDNEFAQPLSDYLANEPKPRNWYINSMGQTFAILQAEPFRMGSFFGFGLFADKDETSFESQINHKFSISTMEVTWDHLRSLGQQTDYFKVDLKEHQGNVAASGISWFQAAHFCNWLSEKEGLPPSQWCYRTNDEDEYGVGLRIKSNFYELEGYRLPTEAEWEFACRAGTTTDRHFGFHDQLLDEYGRHKAISELRVWPGGSLKPNFYGLFDMYGNTYEWCQDRYANYLKNGNPHLRERVEFGVVDDHVRVLRGGSHQDQPGVLRSANRNRHPPAVRYGNHGFRIARSHPNENDQ